MAPRVLIVAENISMRMGGEASLPHYYAKLFTERGVEVWLACHARVESEVRAAFPQLSDRIRVVRDTALQRLIFRWGAILPYRLRDIFIAQILHFSTQKRIRAIAVELAGKGLIDIVFEPSPISPRGLSFMYDVGVPVVIGPLCGGMNFPPGFLHMDNWLTRWLVGAGRSLSNVLNMLVPGKRKASVLLAANASTVKALPAGCRGRVIRLFESGVDLDIWSAAAAAAPPREDGTVHFAFAGRFVDWKGIKYLIAAFAKAVAEEPRCRLHLIGGGELEHVVRNTIAAHGIEPSVTLHGWVPREQAARIIGMADVFVMPSLRECGGTAILEALALGKPVITTRWGGPADYVDDRCGVLVDPSSEAGFIDGLAEAVVRLARSPEQRRTLGEGGRLRVREEHLDWQSKADKVLSILQETCESAQAGRTGRTNDMSREAVLPEPIPAGTATQLRILLIAENVSLTQSGETSVPYYYLIKFLARSLEVQVLCHPRVREELRLSLPGEIFARMHFVEETRLQSWLWRLGKFFHYRIADLVFNQLIYLLSQLNMRRLAARIVREHRLNIVLQPVPISPRTPSYMYGLGVPVVIGPMCGGLELPRGFRHLDGFLVTAAIRAARGMTPLLHRLIPGKLQAATLIVGNRRTAAALPRGVRGAIYEVVESGVDFGRWEPKSYPVAASGAPTRFIFVGRLVDWKGARYLVQAFSRIARKSSVQLDIIGDGEQYAEIAAQIARDGLGDVVQLRGRVPLDQCIGLMRDADVYVMPALRECGGLALLEAMALGLPIIASNWMGPAEYLNAQCAILVDPDSEEALVQGIADAMVRLADDPALRCRLGEHARKRAWDGLYDWDKKVARVVEILDATLAARRAS